MYNNMEDFLITLQSKSKIKKVVNGNRKKYVLNTEFQPGNRHSDYRTSIIQYSI